MVDSVKVAPLLACGRRGARARGKPGKVERARVEMNGDGLAGTDGAIERAGHFDFFRVLAWARRRDLQIVGRGAAVVGSFSEDVGLVSGGVERSASTSSCAITS
jgi:hypothetical protein